jgi:TRAP-type C4-dicarboxylate transport system permease small subunit
MAARQIIAIILIAAGVLGLIYGGFSYTKETHEAKIGPLQFSIKEKETVNVPMWVGIAAIGAGVIVLLVGGRK